MNAKEYLSQIRNLSEAIRKDILEKDTWMSLAMSLSADPMAEKNNPNHGTHAPYERCIENVQELEERIAKRQAALSELKLKVASEIQQLEEQEDIILLTMRYIALMKWGEIGEKFDRSESSVMKKHGKALRHFEEKFEKILKLQSITVENS